MMIPASLMLPLGILLYGWGAQNRLHWIVVDIGVRPFSFRSDLAHPVSCDRCSSSPLP